MKIKLFVFSVFITNAVFCQEPLADKGLEIFCGSENYSNSLEYKLEPVGTMWDVEWPDPSTKIFTIDTDGSSNGGSYTAPYNQDIEDWSGYNYIATSAVVIAEDLGFINFQRWANIFILIGGIQDMEVIIIVLVTVKIFG